MTKSPWPHHVDHQRAVQRGAGRTGQRQRLRGPRYVPDVYLNSEEQLASIVETLELAGGLGIRLWLRGGWAMDFFLGEVTRPHRDIDWFCLVDDVEPLKTAMLADGFTDVTKASARQQLDLQRGGIDHGFALLRLHDDVPVVAGGPWAGEPWPAGMLDDVHGCIGDVRAPIIAPEAQMEIKMMMPEWNPALPRRRKDRDDIAAISRALRHGKGASAASEG